MILIGRREITETRHLGFKSTANFGLNIFAQHLGIAGFRSIEKMQFHVLGTFTFGLSHMQFDIFLSLIHI